MAAERFRRKVMGGYDPSQVDAALEARDERLDQLEREAQQLARRVLETEKRVRGQIGGVGEATSAIAGLGRRLDELGGHARRRALRMRLTARDAMQIAERATELSRLREELGVVVSELAAFAGIGTAVEEERQGRTAPAGERPADGLYRGPVEVEVGPLRDFAQLTSFEDAASEIDSAAEVRVSGFSGGRATFSMNFAQPVALVRELEQRAPFPFQVRAEGAEGVVLDLDGEARGAA
ncbi:MAG: DivIVA domain-containing protein [Actinobacteria bacterium]|nr:DivIVA domain-containing protein [Actinomycetota bacterium]